MHRPAQPCIHIAEVIVDVGVVGDLDDKRSTGARTVRWTIAPPKHAASGEDDNFGGNDEKVCYQCGFPGHVRAHCIHYNERRKHETEFAKAQHQSPPPEIDISSITSVRLDALWYKGGLLYVNGLRVVIGQVLGVVESQWGSTRGGVSSILPKSQYDTTPLNRSIRA
jgi:hypothetical protein